MVISEHHYHNLLAKVHCAQNEPILRKILEIVQPASHAIAHFFYEDMLSHEKSANFINHEIVKNRLHASMSSWIVSAFVYKGGDNLIDDYINTQFKIGHLHGRVDLPMSFVDYGMFLIKSQVMLLLQQSSLNRDELAVAMILSNQILDIGLALINESYQGDLVINEKDAQSFKLNFSSQNLAYDCERLRASLANWMRELLLVIQQNRFDINNISTIRHSHFGLWVVHKAKLFLPETEYNLLEQLLENMDKSMGCLMADFDNLEQRKESLSTLDRFVSKAMWVLEDIAKEIIHRDSGRDPLTRLFNRRYLDTVLRHETECSLKNNLVFGVIMLDIDFFKKINDAHGHDNGDRVLSQLAEILVQQVRAGDFVFRFGGEEFLIVVSDINLKTLQIIGEKIRAKVENALFVVERDEEKQSLAVTVSVGMAIHDGHPDFLRTVKLSDDALYQAKQTGRNRVVVAKLPAIS